MKKLFTLIAAAMMAFASQAYVLTVCDGTELSYQAPIDGFWYDNTTYTQMLYPANMLTDMVGKKITQIKFYSPNIQLRDGELGICIGNTDQTEFAGGDGLVADLYGITVPEQYSTEIVFDLGMPFEYDGRNLLLDVFNYTPGMFGSTAFYGMNFNYNPSMLCYEYLGDAYYEPIGFLPKVTFTYEDGDNPPTPPTPTEKTQTPDGKYEVVSGQHEVIVTITPYEGDVFYRIIYTAPDGTVTEGSWQPYVDSFSVYEDGRYRIEFYAVADGKLPSDPGAVEFTVSPMTGLEEMTTGKTIAGVRYFNMAGQEMQEANGMTIVVTTYTDGTTSAVKVMK